MIIPPNVDFTDWIDFVGSQESQSIHPADYFDGEVEEMLIQASQGQADLLPWSKTHEHVELRSGELSVWAGYNGHKKSLLIGFIMLHLAKTCRVAIASMEMKPRITLYRMACQAGASKVPFEYYKKFSHWGSDRIVIYDQMDSTPGEKILGFIHFAAVKLKCKHIAVDSLTKCGIAKDDMNSEKVFIDRLQWAAKTLDVHIHMVCHMRKPADDKEPRMPTKYSIRGAGEISDLADNCWIIHSNKRKQHIQEKLERTGAALSLEEENELEKPDQFLGIDKQRNGEFEGSWGLWHNHYQFLASDTRQRVEFNLGEEHAARKR